MSIEEAYAAGLFEEIPDEPGMIRMPVVINVSIPYHILWPDEYPAIPAATADPDELQDNSDLERRRIALNGMFETPPYEKDEVNFRELLGVLHPGSLMAAKAAADTAAAENSLQKAGAARSDGPQPDELQDRPDLERGRTGLNGMFGTLSPVAEADFRSLLGVLHPGSLVAAKAASEIAVAKDIVPASGITWSDGPQAVTGLRTPDGTPIVRAQYDEVKGPTSLPEASSDAANEARFDNAVIELKELEPNNPQLSIWKTRDWVPDDAAVRRIERELDAATERAKARSTPVGERVLPLRPTRDVSGSGDRDKLLPSPQPAPLPAKSADGRKKEFPLFTLHELNDGNVEARSVANPEKAAEPGPLPLPPPDGHTVISPSIRFGHVHDGDINASGFAGGFHTRPGGNDPPSARMTQLDKPPDKAGVYIGKVEVKDPNTGKFVLKKGFSSFFPDNLSRDQITKAILDAFHHSGQTRDGKFSGDSGLGFDIQGWYTDGKIETAYPVREGK